MVKRLKFLAVTLTLMMGTVMQAQVTTSSMSGRVTDVDGVVIGASVVATHGPTGTVYGVSTRTDGTYNLPNMRIGGPYTLVVSYIGYHTETFSNINLSLGEDFVLNISLKEDTQLLDEVVVIGERNPIISGNRTGAQEIITREKMDKLPTINRSLTDFTRLTPMSSGSNFGGVSYRFNNVTVDGASFNNSFGLSSSLGASGTEPISLEALEQVQVMIAPYDVRNGGFTGAGINSVTKSGANDFHASAYIYTKSPSMMGYRIKDEVLNVSEFSNKQYGFSLSGAFIKNKLFYYINAEIDRQETPITYTTANSAVDAIVLQDLSNFLQTNLNYNPGSFDLTKRNTQADRLTARVDWNINVKNVLSLKYYYLKSFNTNNPSTSGTPLNGRGPNEYAIPYTSSFYRVNNNFNILMADLNTIINDNMSNYLKIGYSRLRDFRDMDGGFFPQVDILNGSGQAYTTFGTEANSYNNQLDTDIWQIQDNFIINLDNHQLTFGTQSDYRAFRNGFAQNYPGSWVFASVDDFKFNVLATRDYLSRNNGSIKGFDIRTFDPTTYGFASTVTGLSNSTTSGGAATTYQQKYAIGDQFPFAEVNVFQIGLYAQDKWKITDKLNVTLGLRMDIPVFVTDLPENEAVAAETYRDGIKIDVSKLPSAKPQFSPRLGFNYNPLDDSSLQLRGGTGLFSGTPPYVWISNQAANNGVLFGDINYGKPDEKASLGFTGDLDSYKPAAGSATRADLAVTAPDFKYPNLWKSNVAADYKFLDGWIATVELLYSKDLNAIYHDNIGLMETDKFVKEGSQNLRPMYNRSYYSDQPGNKEAGNNVVMLRNTNKGYSFYTTLQLQRTFYDGVLEGLYVNGSYSFGSAKSVTDGTSSVATSAWRYRPAIDPNAEELGYSAGAFDGRLLLSASYTMNWDKNAATNIGLIYQRYRPFRYSYTYNGDVNGDLRGENDLIYVPKDANDINIVLERDRNGNLVDDRSIDDVRKQINQFINQDPYLSKHRGEFAERNGAKAPFANQLDFSLYHDIKVIHANGRPHTLRFSFNIQNFLNLLNRNWGVQQTTVLGDQQYQFLKVTQTPSATNNYEAGFTMPLSTTKQVIEETFKDNLSNASRWQMQFGLKYIF